MAKSRAKSRHSKSKNTAASSSSRGRPSGRSPKGKSKSGRKPLEIKVTRARGKKDAWESRAVFSSNTSGTMFRSIGVNTEPVEFAADVKMPRRAKVPKNEPLLQKVVTYMRTFNHARALSALLTSPSVRSALPAVVEVEVRIKEVQRFVKKPLSFPSPQIVATGDKTHRDTESAWGHILAEFKKEMPVFYMSCMAALAPKNKQYTINNPDSYESSNRGRLGMMMTIPLFTRRERKFQYLSSLIGGQLWRHGCRQRIFHELYRLGVSQRRHGSMDAARWLEGETTKGDRIMKQKYKIMDEVEALQNGVLPSAERYETSDDEGSSESDDDESEEEVEESSDGESEEDLLEESDEEDEIMAKPERVRGRGKRGQHQVVIEEAVMEDNWQNDAKGKRSSSEVVISEMVKIAEQMSETSEQMKSSMKRKRSARPDEVTVLSQDNNQIVLQVSKEGMTTGIPISDASSGLAMPIMVESSGQGGTMNINQVMMDGIPTQIVQQEVVTEEEMDPEMMAAQLLQHVLPTEIITTTQTIPQEVVTSSTLQTVTPEQGVHNVVTIQASQEGQQTIVTQNIVPQEIVQEQVVQEIQGEEIIQEIVQQEVVTEGTLEEGATEGEVLQSEMVPTQIITDMGDGEMATVVVTTEVVTTDEGGTTQVLMVAEDQRTPAKRPAETEPESEGKRKRKIRAPYSP
nr:LOW QUALITY PROTEIN: uncharacterized protein LOC129256734 [Lytechinus pictus]